jgi:hypothetical protein
MDEIVKELKRITSQLKRIGDLLEAAAMVTAEESGEDFHPYTSLSEPDLSDVLR